MNTTRSTLAALAAMVAAFVLVVGCSTLDLAMSMVGRQVSASSGGAPSSSENASNQPQPAEAAQPSPRPSGPSAIQVYQMQFYAVYSIATASGGYTTGDGGYKPGEGTVWEFSGSGHGKGVSTIEHAYLKLNADGTQWWRVHLTSGKDSLLYEFLRSGDTVLKVRFKDPESGQVEEFVPEQATESQQAATPAPVVPPSEADQANIKRDKATVKVKAGTFATEHAIYTDNQDTYRSEVWTSSSVPGEMVKFSTKNLRSGEADQGELVKIESGVATVLQSY